MGSRTAISRVYFIHQEVKAGRYPNVPSLVEQLEYSERTIRRDLEFMRDRLGAPLEYDRSKRGYFYTESFQLPDLLLTEEELEAIWVAHQWLRQARGTPYEQAMQRAWEKLSIVFGASRVTWDDWMVVGVATSKSHEPICQINTYRQLQEAARQRQVVRIEYYSPANDTVTTRDIEPILLYLTSDACYCVAYCRLRRSHRTFALNRIRSLRVLNESFPPMPMPFNLDEYFEGSMGVMRGDLMHLKIRFSHEQARYLEEYSRHESQTRLNEDASGVVYSFEVADNLETMRWVLSYGAAATVVSPLTFAAKIHQELVMASKNYEIDS